MRRAFVTSSLFLLVVLAVACGSSSNPADAGTQKDFGVRMARMNLWREAMFRFKRAVEINPNDAMAHNNLAVAYEANGEFDKAADEYRTAIRLDKANSHIQKNYSRFVEFTQRNKKRQQPPAQQRTAATATTPTGGTAVSVTSTAIGPPPTETTGTAVTQTTPPPPPSSITPPTAGGSR
jgi:Tfp pilus assembly protein PilF